MCIRGIKTCRKSCVVCLISLPLQPPGEIVQTVSDIRPEIADDGQHVEGLKKVVVYIKQWLYKRSVGPERLSDNRSRTNNVMETGKLLCCSEASNAGLTS